MIMRTTHPVSLASIAAFICCVAPAGETTTRPSTTQPTTRPQPYEAFDADVQLLRQVQIVKTATGELRASSFAAVDSAQRVFSRVAFLHRSRREVLDMLGDPRTISDYGVAAADDPSAPLIYVFDTGWGGLKYTLKFHQGMCVALQADGMY
jgi:hypothetical protein